MTDTPPRPVISTTRAAAMLSVVPDSVRRWCAEGVLDHYRTPGGHYRVYLNAVQDILDIQHGEVEG